MTKPTEKKVVYRDSKDGQFVKHDYAVKHPATTERQHVPVVPPSPPKGKPSK